MRLSGHFTPRPAHARRCRRRRRRQSRLSRRHRGPVTCVALSERAGHVFSGSLRRRPEITRHTMLGVFCHVSTQNEGGTCVKSFFLLLSRARLMREGERERECASDDETPQDIYLAWGSDAARTRRRRFGACLSAFHGSCCQSSGPLRSERERETRELTPPSSRHLWIRISVMVEFGAGPRTTEYSSTTWFFFKHTRPRRDRIVLSLSLSLSLSKQQQQQQQQRGYIHIYMCTKEKERERERWCRADLFSTGSCVAFV